MLIAAKFHGAALLWAHSGSHRSGRRLFCWCVSHRAGVCDHKNKSPVRKRRTIAHYIYIRNNTRMYTRVRDTRGKWYARAPGIIDCEKRDHISRNSKWFINRLIFYFYQGQKIGFTSSCKSRQERLLYFIPGNYASYQILLRVAWVRFLARAHRILSRERGVRPLAFTAKSPCECCNWRDAYNDILLTRERHTRTAVEIQDLTRSRIF